MQTTNQVPVTSLSNNGEHTWPRRQCHRSASSAWALTHARSSFSMESKSATYIFLMLEANIITFLVALFVTIHLSVLNLPHFLYHIFDKKLSKWLYFLNETCMISSINVYIYWHKVDIILVFIFSHMYGMIYVSICTFNMTVWKYARSKNDDSAISESKVTRTVANKFGGSCMANEHVPDITNYPTSRLRKLNLK